MTAYRWRSLTRTELGELLPEGIVILPIGATEQHGPHLATATDALMAETVATRGSDLAASQGCERPLIVTPTMAFGASDHHLPFGGTLSLRAETLLDVLLDLLRSIHMVGGRRVLIVNGHGGNRGICSAAIAAASSRYAGLEASYLDYWSLLTDLAGPGHAGVFETSLALALDPALVRDPVARADPPAPPAVDRVETASQGHWRMIDGYTDSPADASVELGERWLEQLVAIFSVRITELARTP